MTVSPTCTELTAEPTSCTHPAFSWPTMNGSPGDVKSHMPSRTCRSVRQTPAPPVVVVAVDACGEHRSPCLLAGVAASGPDGLGLALERSHDLVGEVQLVALAHEHPERALALRVALRRAPQPPAQERQRRVALGLGLTPAERRCDLLLPDARGLQP